MSLCLLVCLVYMRYRIDVCAIRQQQIPSNKFLQICSYILLYTWRDHWATVFDENPFVPQHVATTATNAITTYVQLQLNTNFSLLLFYTLNQFFFLFFFLNKKQKKKKHYCNKASHVISPLHYCHVKQH